MPDTFALIQATVPSSTTLNVAYTDSAITDWSFAIIVISGADGQTGAKMSIAFVDAAGNAANLSATARDGDTSAQVQSFHRGNETASGQVIQVTNDGAPTTGRFADASFSGALSNGFELDWTISGGGTYEMFILLFGGLTDEYVGREGDEAAGPGFEADAVLGLGFTGSFAADNGLDFIMDFGACINDGSETQACAAVQFERTAVSFGRAFARDGRYAGTISASNTEEGDAITAFTGTGFTTSATGTPETMFAALEWSDPRTSAVAIESLSGGQSGDTAFTGLGIRPAFIFGIITGNSTTDALQSGSSVSRTCIFASDGTNTYSTSAAFRSGVDVSAGGPSEGYSNWNATSVEMLDHVGATDFLASVSSLDATGFTLNITNSVAGRMLVWCVGGADLLARADETASHVENVRPIPGVVTRLDETMDLVENDRSLLTSTLEVMEPSSNARISQPGLYKGRISPAGGVSDAADLG
jgi:hypothetical protein